MSRLFFFAIVAVSGLQALADESLGDCLQAGAEIGRQRTAQFCRVLTQRHSGQEQQFYLRHVPAQFCQLAASQQCRDAMWTSLSDDRFCESLVRQDWEAAFDSFASTVEMSCPDPEVVACRRSSDRIHKGFWCHDPFEGSYSSFALGRWWSFVRNVDGRDGDERHYLVRAENGDTRILPRWQFAIVRRR